MTESSGPFSNGSWGQPQWGRTAKLWLPDCVEALHDDELTYIANGAMQGALKYGNAWVKGFGYRNENTYVTFNHSSSTATAGQSRNDLIVLRLNKGTGAINAALLTGTFAVTPLDPALTQDDSDAGIWEMPIARVNVVANAAALGTITMIRNLHTPGLRNIIRVSKTLVDGAQNNADTMDTNLAPIYIKSTDARHWWRVRYLCSLTASGVGQIVVNMRLRDSGSTTPPTALSTQLAVDSANFVASAGQLTSEAWLADVIQLPVGDHYLGISVSKAAGTPSVAPTGTRSLTIECLGFSGPQ